MDMPNFTGSVQEFIQTDAVANSGNSGGPWWTSTAASSA